SRLLVIVLFHDTSTTEIYTLSLHDALPIWNLMWPNTSSPPSPTWPPPPCIPRPGARRSRRGTLGERWRSPSVERDDWSSPVRWPDRKSTRLNSSHSQISYAVFCLKKKKKIQ